jgi:hypothetical protein
MTEAAREAVTTGDEIALDIYTEDQLATLKCLCVEAENLLELLSEDTDSNIRWGDERKEIERTLREAKEVLWP